jgi:hypothetical protein
VTIDVINPGFPSCACRAVIKSLRFLVFFSVIAKIVISYETSLNWASNTPLAIVTEFNLSPSSSFTWASIAGLIILSISLRGLNTVSIDCANVILIVVAALSATSGGQVGGAGLHGIVCVAFPGHALSF